MADSPRQDGSAAAQNQTASDVDLDELVASTDTGGRNPDGLTKKILLGAALAWSLFQLWIASPIPFIIGIGVFNDTEARSIHLAFALFLVFLAYPPQRSGFQIGLGIAIPMILATLFAFGTGGDMPVWQIFLVAIIACAAVALKSPHHRVPVHEWFFAGLGALSGAYLFMFYEDIASRVGAPIYQDFLFATIGIILLLEATRRSLGPALMIVATVFLVYTFLGPYMPGIIAHKGNSFSEVVNHQWITTEGVFGIALGVSTSFVFLFVLFGSLLDKAGAGNYFIQVAFSLMGHMRGGPAKAAVVSSAMTGLISGSSIANVVTTGTFTIPLMKRVGFSAEKAGAVEVSSSVNGQIMPPVMGAAAFLMVEYVGIPYFDVVTHAFLPATISYIALVYIVHLEAMKAGMEGLPRAYTPKPIVQRLIGFVFGVAVISGVSLAVYYAIGWIRPALGPTANWIIAAGVIAAYVFLVSRSAKVPDLHMDDPDEPMVRLPLPGPTIKSGLHFLLPVVVLVWALMVERLSPGLSAFWASAFMIVILLTQRPLIAFFRGEADYGERFRLGFQDLIDGLITGARNMIGIAVATATAGIIVGAVSQTGVGSALAEVVEVLSGGNLLAILFLTAVLSLILGMGLPTTANYIVVSALLAPVIVTLGQQNGLIVPLIAVHLFVFYFGLMADVTPPVGLASFAAAAVSGGDPIRTGFVAFFYSLRTAALPFLFIFNTDLLLIDVDVLHGVFIFVAATVAMLLFAAATQGYFLARNKIHEGLILALCAFIIFRPGFFWDMVFPPYEEKDPHEIFEAAAATPAGEDLRLRIAGVNEVGDPIEFVVLLPMGDGESGEEKLASAGLTVVVEPDKVVIDNAAFGSVAANAGLDWDQNILRVLKPLAQPSKYLAYLPVTVLLALVIIPQRRRTALIIT